LLVEGSTSTLLCVVIKGDRFLATHIGDGAIVALEGDNLIVVSELQNGEFINITTFVTSATAQPTMRLTKGDIGKIGGFALMSDGAAESLYQRHTKKIAPVVKTLMHKNALLSKDYLNPLLQESLEQKISQRTQDDCSIAIISRQNETLVDLFQMSSEERCEWLGVDSHRRFTPDRVRRYIKILKEFPRNPSVNDVANLLSMSDRSAYRYISYLRDMGFYEKTAAGLVRPNLLLLSMA
jgi:serine/threonine protein phosphatase PrpC